MATVPSNLYLLVIGAPQKMTTSAKVKIRGPDSTKVSVITSTWLSVP
ncbi:hypothetical protein VCRA2119O147_2530007 [Vibrio crassostreae]|nr:hypothetical protein VCRA2113O140_100004 [Vibrio crassostreae]CAK1747210.1 hypothetical protein VCRA2113O137_120161 [Vibrio crassostreae]CAK1780809.1 hypothetical protein VCRA2110O135_150106 [Vibrio crassostreae]CAK1783182.1 hypothetical protein VCRA2119O145_170007 [Vibrio crassostreae]CAK1806082.1 hypothetical protein VCRA2119O381_150062 [Vibrio crassostreae]